MGKEKHSSLIYLIFGFFILNTFVIATPDIESMNLYGIHMPIVDFTIKTAQALSGSQIISTTRGPDYSTILYSNGTKLSTFGLPEYVEALNGSFVPYILSNDSTHIYIDSKTVPISMSKIDCTLTVYSNSNLIRNNPSVLIGQHFYGITVKQTGQSWVERPVKNIPCTYQTSSNSTGLYLTIQRSEVNWGNLTSIYSFPNNGQPEVYNSFLNLNPAWASGYKIDFVSVNKNINLSALNFNGTIFQNFNAFTGNGLNLTSSQLTNNGISILATNQQLFSYDQSDVINDVKNVIMNYNGTGQLNIKIHYGKQTPITTEGQTISQDPKWGYLASTTTRGITINGETTTKCEPPLGSDSTFMRLYLTSVNSFNGCRVYVLDWNISALPSNIIVTSATLEIDNSITQNARTCDFVQINVNPVSSSSSVLWNAIDNGTAYVSGSSICTTTATGQTAVLGTQAVTDIQNRINGNVFALGFRYDNRTTDSSIHDTTQANPYLQIAYNTLPDIPNIANATMTGTPILNWTTPNGNGYTTNGYTGQIYNGASFISLFGNQSATNYNMTQTGNQTQKVRIYSGNHLGSSLGYAYPINSTLSTYEQLHVPFDYNMHDVGRLQDGGSLGAGTENYTSSGHNGAARIYDGSSYDSFPKLSGFNFTNTTPFTISVYVQTTQTGSNATIIGKGTTFHSTAGYYLTLSGSHPYFELYGSDGKYYGVQSSKVINNGDWQNVLVRFDGSNHLNFYINGTNDTSVTVKADTLDASTANTVALTTGGTAGGTSLFTGNEDELYVFSTKMNTQTITDFANEQLTLPASIPRNLTAIQDHSIISQVDLSWNAPAHNGGSAITGYKIERSATGGATWFTVNANTGTSAVTYSDTGVPTGATWTYRVSAINGIGTSKPSVWASELSKATFVINAYQSDGSTTISGSITQSNSTSHNNIFTLSSGTVSLSGISGLQNITALDSSTLFIVKKQIFYNATGNPDNIDSNIFKVTCPTTGSSPALLLYTSNESNYHYITSVSSPTCYSNSTVKWHVYFSPNGDSGTGTTTIRALVENNTYAINPTSLKANSTTITTSFQNPWIISSPITVGSGTSPIGIYYSMQLALSPSSSPINYTAGSLAINGSNPIVFPISFSQTNPSCSESDVAISFPQTYVLTATISYSIEQKTITYNSIPFVSGTVGYDVSTFKFKNATNDVITIVASNANSPYQSATYSVVPNQSCLNTNTNSSIPLFQDIKNFQNGTYGTKGQVGAINLVVLVALIFSMIGLNRVNESLGLVVMVMILGALSYYNIVTFPTILIPAMALVLLITVASTKKLPWS